MAKKKSEAPEKGETKKKHEFGSYASGAFSILSPIHYSDGSTPSSTSGTDRVVKVEALIRNGPIGAFTVVIYDADDDSIIISVPKTPIDLKKEAGSDSYYSAMIKIDETAIDKTKDPNCVARVQCYGDTAKNSRGDSVGRLFTIDI